MAIQDSHIPLREFQIATELPAEGILQLLYDCALPIVIHEGVVCVDIHALDVDTVARSLSNDEHPSGRGSSLVFQMRQVIREFLVRERQEEP